MSTLADELLQDFEGSGSEAGDGPDDDLFGEAGLSAGAHTNGQDAAMEEMRDEDADEDEDADMADGADIDTASGTDGDDAKARIEKMQLGNVRDVRAVAGLMSTLTPVLEVSAPLSLLPQLIPEKP